jgi:hypothetical protein
MLVMQCVLGHPWPNQLGNIRKSAPTFFANPGRIYFERGVVEVCELLRN